MSNKLPNKFLKYNPGGQACHFFRHRKFRGFTMIELIVFIVVVGAALVGVFSVLNLTTLKSADPVIQKNMLSIAEALLEEVELMPFTFCDPSTATGDPAQTWVTATSTTGIPAPACTFVQGMGPANGEARISNAANPFNNVGDYSGGTQGSTISGAAVGLGSATQAITDITGSNLAPSGYTATIGLTAENLGPTAFPITSSPGSAATMNVFRITVSVTNGANTIVLEGYRARYWPNNLAW